MHIRYIFVASQMKLVIFVHTFIHRIYNATLEQMCQLMHAIRLFVRQFIVYDDSFQL